MVLELKKFGSWSRRK